jgi:hypothetical protein
MRHEGTSNFPLHFSVCFENDVSILYVLLNTGHIITKNNIREILVIPLKK